MGSANRDRRQKRNMCELCNLFPEACNAWHNKSADICLWHKLQFASFSYYK